MADLSERLGEVRLIKCDKYRMQITSRTLGTPMKAKDICLTIDTCDSGINLGCPYWIKLNRKV